MIAGFAKENITPPVGTYTAGIATPETDLPSESVHDDIFVRTLYVSHKGEEAVIISFDLLFLSKEECDRFKGAIGLELDLKPKQIMITSTHSHLSPMVGDWALSDYKMPDRLYLRELEKAVVKTAVEAKNKAKQVEIFASKTKSELPMNRRRKNEDGIIENRPNPGGVVHDTLPVCMMKDSDGKVVCLMFSVACHPSIYTWGYDLSAEYPGVAVNKLNSYLGTDAAMFLQGTAGDAKLTVTGAGQSHFKSGTWEDVEKAGNILADEVIDAIEAGMEQIEPDLHTAITVMRCKLQQIRTKEEFIDVVDKPVDKMKTVLWKLWAERMIERIDRDEKLADYAPIIVHGVNLGKNLRIIGIEGEPTAPLGILTEIFFGGGITFALGYTNGTGMYLPVSNMIEEGGYEVRSFYEYGWPAPLDKGVEISLEKALVELKSKGIK